MHGIEHWTHFYTDYGRELQLRFFDYFLHGKKNGWDKQAPVQLQVRHIDSFVERDEQEWPLKRTKWTKLLSRSGERFAGAKAAKKKSALKFDAMGDGVTFMTPPLEHETEITGPSALKLFVSSSTKDADIFAVLRVFSPDLNEVVFQGAIDPHAPIGQGWLRASHRELDKKLSTPYRPYHTHTKKQPLKPGEVVRARRRNLADIASSFRPATASRSRSAARTTSMHGPSGGRLSNFKNELTGCGPFLHDDVRDRPPEIFSGVTGLHFGGAMQPYLLLPIIPAKPKAAKAVKAALKKAAKKAVKKPAKKPARKK